MKTHHSRENFLVLHLTHIYQITNRINVRTMYRNDALTILAYPTIHLSSSQLLFYLKTIIEKLRKGNTNLRKPRDNTGRQQTRPPTSNPLANITKLEPTRQGHKVKVKTTVPYNLQYIYRQTNSEFKTGQKYHSR